MPNPLQPYSLIISPATLTSDNATEEKKCAGWNAAWDVDMKELAPEIRGAKKEVEVMKYWLEEFERRLVRRHYRLVLGVL